MKYPIGIQSFETLRRDGYVYVDKTDLVYKLAQGHIYFLARPRRLTVWQQRRCSRLRIGVMPRPTRPTRARYI